MFKLIFPVLLLTFVNTLGFSILIPVMPFIVREAGASDVVQGLLISAYSGSQFCGALLLGKLSDYYGRKPILIISQAGTLFSWIIFGLAWFIGEYYDAVYWSLIVIAIARFTDGITGGNNSVANAYLSDKISPDKRAVVFGYVGAVLGLGIIIGPAIGAFTSNSEIGYLGMVIFSITLSTVTLLAITFKLPESLPLYARKTTTKETKVTVSYLLTKLLNQVNIFKSITYFKDRKIIVSVFTVKFFISIALASYSTIIILLLIDRFALTKTQVGYFLFVVGGFMVLNQIFIVKIFIKYFGEIITLLSGMIFMGSGLLIFPVLENLWLFIAFYYLTNLGINLAMPTIRSIASREATKQEQGQIMGIDESIFSLSMTFMPIISSWLYDHIGWKTFIIWGCTTLAGALVFFIQNKIRFKKQEPKAL